MEFKKYKNYKCKEHLKSRWNREKLIKIKLKSKKGTNKNVNLLFNIISQMWFFKR